MLRTLAISLITLFSPVLYSCEKTPELTAATDNTQKETEESGINPLTLDPAGKTLIAYYTFSGDCRSIVASMTSQMDADVLEIQPAEEGLDYAANNYSSGISSVVADAKRLIPEGKFVEESLWINSSNRSGKDGLVKNWLSSF